DRIDSRDDAEDPTPAAIRGKGNETAFWGIIRREMRKAGLDGEAIAPDVAVRMAAIVETHRTVGWQNDRDLQNRMRNAIDDYFFDDVLASGAADMTPEVIDRITDDVLAAARVRMADHGRGG
ncbi:MAG: hypothetical protein ACYC8V_11640, partial [Caulobacteraceae bacterium]